MHRSPQFSLEFEEDGPVSMDPAYVNKVPHRSVASPDEASIDLHDLAADEENVERRVLVLYTGGTIGMIRNQDNVLAPCPGIMESRLRKYPNMHDHEYAQSRFKRHDTAALVLPMTNLGDSRVIYTVYEYEPLLDSSNMTMDDWIRIAKDIKQAYHWFDGFVILHGTDTMAYTASALSFMLENLGKSVVITGSQIPIFEARSDGRDNFLLSLLLAGQYVIPEVTVCFSHELYRGNRTTKLSTGKLNAFGSPNLPPLATVGIDIAVDYRSMYRSPNIARFEVHTRLCRNVGLLRLFPSITTATVRAFLQEPIEGVVLQSYGAGNVPSNRKDLLEALSAASARGVIIVNCTQCSQGSVNAVYETGKTLLDAGVVPGADMTPEAALTKLAYVLSKNEWDLATKRKMIQQNVRGELTMHQELELCSQDLVTVIAQKMRLTSPGEVDRLRETLYPAMLCCAAQNGAVDRLETLVGYGADVSGMDYERRTALHVAASEGDAAVLRRLLQMGASVHVRDRSGATPLQAAVQYQRLDCIQILVDCGANLVMAPAALGEQLCSAAAAGRVTMLEAYRLAGADLGQADATGRTALHVAALSGNSDICSLLLSYGVNPYCEDMLGFSPAAYAQMAGNYDIGKRLEKLKISASVAGGGGGGGGARAADSLPSSLSSFLATRFVGGLTPEAVAELSSSPELRQLPGAGGSAASLAGAAGNMNISMRSRGSQNSLGSNNSSPSLYSSGSPPRLSGSAAAGNLACSSAGSLASNSAGNLASNQASNLASNHGSNPVLFNSRRPDGSNNHSPEMNGRCGN